MKIQFCLNQLDQYNYLIYDRLMDEKVTKTRNKMVLSIRLGMIILTYFLSEISWFVAGMMVLFYVTAPVLLSKKKVTQLLKTNADNYWSHYQNQCSDHFYHLSFEENFLMVNHNGYANQVMWTAYNRFEIQDEYLLMFDTYQLLMMIPLNQLTTSERKTVEDILNKKIHRQKDIFDDPIWEKKFGGFFYATKNM